MTDSLRPVYVVGIGGRKGKGLKGEGQPDHFVISPTFIMLPRAGQESLCGKPQALLFLATRQAIGL